MIFVSFSLFSAFLFGATPDSLLHQFIKCCPNRKISLLKTLTIINANLAHLLPVAKLE